MRIDRKYPTYSLDNIEQRIIKQQKIKKHCLEKRVSPKKMLLHGSFKKAHHTSGMRGLYLYYCYRLGIFSKKKAQDEKQLPFLYREDLRKMEQISQEARFLCKYRINNLGELGNYKDENEEQIKKLCRERKKLWNKTRHPKEEKEQLGTKEAIAKISEQIKRLRKEVKYCASIATRSLQMKAKIKSVTLEEKSDSKERKRNEYKR
ncbi:MAG: hypothetical protein RSC76_10195 [Oscillospiraceae bacterium]